MHQISGTRMKQRDKIVLTALFSGIVVFLIYLPALFNGFVNWDDSIYVHENYGIHKIGANFLQWAFSTTIGGNWHPLTIISLAIDYQVWGLNPFGYHLVNNLLHALNASLFTLLVIILYKKILPETSTGNLLLGGLLASFLWGLHPQRVESVAWISERKDVLSTFFYLLSLITYTKFRVANSKSAYAITLVLFLFALMSKAMAISLPVVMIIIDFIWIDDEKKFKVSIFNKIPFFLIACLIAFLTIWTQTQAGAVTSESFDMSFRILNAIRSYGFYIYKMFIPVGLAPYYPLMPDISLKVVVLSSGLLLAVSAATIWAYAKGNRFFLAAWVCFLITLAPVSGIIQVGTQAAADRYTYLPSLPLFMAIGIGSIHSLQKWVKIRTIAFAFLIVANLTFSFLTIKQIGIWKDAIALWEHEIKHYPVVFAYLNRAPILYNLKRYKEAIEDYSIALDSLEDKNLLSNTYVRRGLAFQAIGAFQQAKNDYSAAISFNPRNIGAYNNRANIYKKHFEYGLAVRDYQSAISIGGDNPVIYFNLGRTYLDMGDTANGTVMIEKASNMGLQAAKDFLKEP